MWMRFLPVFLLVVTVCARAATEIAPDTWVIPGATPPNAQPDGNTVIIDAPAGLIVFDTGRHVAHTQQILDFAKEKQAPIKAIINSHWHLDHVGGNVMLRREYPAAPVYASGALQEALGGFLARYRAQLVDAVAQSTDTAAQESFRAEIGLIDAAPMLQPTYVVHGSGRRTIAGYDLDVKLERSAVTAGDLWVMDPKTRVLLAGDLVTLPAPFLDTACPKHWRSALGDLAGSGFRVLVPGHGAPMDHEGLKVYRNAFDGLLDCAASAQPKGACIDGWMSDADTLIPAADHDYARGALDYYMEQVLRGHDEQIAKLCTLAPRREPHPS
jgi:glyoxylase-like metal-dependent hydrolase (beta-lactamase superfamily II)